MKKIAITAAAAVTLVSGAFASALTWGQFGTVTDWNGNDGTATSYAVIYLLTGDGVAPTFDATSGTWDMKGATYLDTKAYDDAIVGGWGDQDGTEYSAVDASTQQYFGIFMTSENTSNLASLVGDGKYFAFVGSIAGDQQMIPGMGSITYYTDVSSFDDVAKSNWTEAKAVPEPTTVALLALGLAAVGLKRKVA